MKFLLCKGSWCKEECREKHVGKLCRNKLTKKFVGSGLCRPYPAACLTSFSFKITSIRYPCMAIHALNTRVGGIDENNFSRSLQAPTIRYLERSSDSLERRNIGVIAHCEIIDTTDRTRCKTFEDEVQHGHVTEEVIRQ